VSLFGASIRALAGLICDSGDGGACAGESCGGGVGSCIGTSMLESTLSFALKPGDGFNSCVVTLRASSGGQVARLVLLSCSIGESMASSGVGIVR
jgi:hypothetical protein